MDVSCSGADSTDLTGSQLPGVGPQLDALTAETDLVTVSIGGNDFDVSPPSSASARRCGPPIPCCPWPTASVSRRFRINGQVTDPARAQSFHPFLTEQTAVAELVVAALR